MFDVPQPFGPTIAVTPGKNSSVVFSANDLKPMSCRLFRYIGSPPLSLRATIAASSANSSKKLGIYASAFIRKSVDRLRNFVADDALFHPPYCQQIRRGFEQAVPHAVVPVSRLPGLMADRNFHNCESFHPN